MDKSISSTQFELTREETPNFPELNLLANLNVLRDTENKIKNYVITIHDISRERKEEGLKQHFLDLISHKLLTPLTSICLGVNSLKELMVNEDNDDKKSMIKIIEKKSEQLKTLIEKLIGFVSFEKIRHYLRMEKSMYETLFIIFKIKSQNRIITKT